MVGKLSQAEHHSLTRSYTPPMPLCPTLCSLLLQNVTEHVYCLLWNSLGSTPPAMDTRSRAPPTRTFTVINVIIVCPDGFDNSYTSAKRSTHTLRSIRRIFVSFSILQFFLYLWRKYDNQMSDFITRETVLIKEDPWGKT